jgi:hypothetical protein
MPAKIMLASTLACPSPPLRGRTVILTKVKRRFVIPPVFINLPARRKNGMASRRKLSIFAKAERAIMMGTRGSAKSPKKVAAPIVEMIPAPNPTGTPMIISTMSETARSA